MRTIVAVSLLALLACAPVQTPMGAGSSSMTDNGTLFIGGTVAVGHDQTPRRDIAIHVVDGVIRETGAAAGLREAHPHARVIDASNATILPGLVDAHAHLYGLGLRLRNVDLAGTNSFQEVIRRMKERADTRKAGEWVIGRGWDQNDWPEREFPTVAALDATIPEHPVMLRRIDGHAVIANAAAMRIAGVTAATPDPDGGRIVRDATGNPTGVFVDNAMALIESHVPQPSQEERKTLVLAAAREIAANGLTGIHDAGIDGNTITAVKELIDEKRFPIRVYGMLTDSDLLLNAWLPRGPLIDYGGRLTIRSLKMYADGALGSRGAALLEPYSDDPSNRGLVVTSAERLRANSARASAAGFQVMTHAIGDRGVREVLDAYVSARVTPDKRFRIEHAQVIALEDIPRFKAYGVIASVQPTHATSDMDWAERRVGSDRIHGAYAWRKLLDAGVRLALGSDFPVERVSPFLGIHAAVNRTDVDGQPAGGWYPAERLTLAEAVRGFSLDAAWAAFQETSRGTIEPGRLADLTIVEGDFYATPAADLHRTKVLLTVVGGEVVAGETH